MDPVPRLIQPRSPVYNLALGRYTRRVEEELYHALSVLWDVEESEKVVMKGLTVEEVAAQLRRNWDYFPQSVAVGLDASRFDQHVSVDALKWEHRIYRRIFNECPELAALLKCQLHGHGMAFLDSCRVDYETEGCRSSGDMNTALGNCIIMSSLVWLYCKDKGVNARLANNGDDCLVFMDRRQLAQFQGGLAQWFAEFGFTMTVEEPVYTFERCEFCQARPVWSGCEWVMCRIPQTAVSKDVMGLACSTVREYQQWSYGVGMGGLSLYGDFPLFGALYRRMVETGVPSGIRGSLLLADSGFTRMSMRPRRHAQRTTVDDECRLSFYRAFGITPDVQLEFEHYVSKLDFSVVVQDPGVGLEFAPPLTDHLGNA